jgi:hypothetical protein
MPLIHTPLRRPQTHKAKVKEPETAHHLLDSMDDMEGESEMKSSMLHPAHIVMAVMKKRKMADGGVVKDYGQQADTHEDAAKKSIASAFGAPSEPKKKMADGGLVDEDDLMEHHLGGPMDEEDSAPMSDMDAEEEMKQKRKGMISKIMGRLQSKHRGLE